MAFLPLASRQSLSLRIPRNSLRVGSDTLSAFPSVLSCMEQTNRPPNNKWKLTKWEVEVSKKAATFSRVSPQLMQPRVKNPSSEASCPQDQESRASCEASCLRRLYPRSTCIRSQRRSLLSGRRPSPSPSTTTLRLSEERFFVHPS